MPCGNPQSVFSGTSYFGAVGIQFMRDSVEDKTTASWNAQKWTDRGTFSVRTFAIVMSLVLALGYPSEAEAYAVLAHEAIVDSVWGTHIRPLLLQRFPRATAAEVKEAHSYTYGGAIIQDMGYYPHGSFFFSDLTHYVRSGDFVLALLRDSKDINGYAFALGALAHYAADNDGHPIATNRAVPILYPKLKKKHGDSVTYEEDKLRT
jgi:zinc dependent phospholipase C